MLTLNSISKTYDNGVNALADVTLTINNGLFGLLGPNGAGKSSLMRTIATLQHADSGSIQFDGIDVLSNPMAMRRRLGYLPQSFGVYPRVSAVDLLNHLAMLKGINNKSVRRKTIDYLLEVTNLTGHRKRAVSDFSGGMRQRFGIAQALLGNPDLLIVDEPTAGLDPEERNRFHNLLVSLAQNKIIILSTHIVADITELCPNMAMLVGGRIVRSGSPHALIAELNGRIWRKTLQGDESQSCSPDITIISRRLFAGHTIVHALADTAPPGFVSTVAGLEDVYFSTLLATQVASC